VNERDFPLNSKTVVQREPRALSTSENLLQSDAGAKEETKEILDPPITTCVYDRVTGKRIFGTFLAKENKEDETEQSRLKRLCLQNSVFGSRPIQ
jgi:hypothetical protein